MARWAPRRADVIDELAGEMLATFPNGRVLVAVDGFDDERTASFAHDLATALAANGVSAADVRMRDFAHGADGRYEDRYDVSEFRHELLEPLRRDEALPAIGLDAGERRAIVVSGRYLLRQDLVGIWTSTIWLDSPLDDSLPAGPDGEAQRREGLRYLHQVDPKRRTATNVDGTDPEHPRRTFADSC